MFLVIRIFQTWKVLMYLGEFKYVCMYQTCMYIPHNEKLDQINLVIPFLPGIYYSNEEALLTMKGQQTYGYKTFTSGWPKSGGVYN